MSPGNNRLLSTRYPILPTAKPLPLLPSLHTHHNPLKTNSESSGSNADKTDESIGVQSFIIEDYHCCVSALLWHIKLHPCGPASSHCNPLPYQIGPTMIRITPRWWMSTNHIKWGGKRELKGMKATWFWKATPGSCLVLGVRNGL